MATSEEIKNALIGQLATFNGSSTEEQAMASENIGKIYVPTDEDVIIINKRRVGCGRNATTEKDGLMSVNDKKNLDYMTVHLDGIDTTLADIPNTYATKEEVEEDFIAVNNSLAIASSTATEALGKANEAKGKVDNIISGTTVVPTATNAQEAQKATQDGSGNEITKTYATKAELKTTNDSLGTTAATANDAKSKVDRIISGTTVVPSATNAQIAQTATNLANNPTLAKGTNNTNAITVKAGGKKSDEFVVPYATTADKATKDGSGNNIVNTYATKEELNDKLNASDAMVLAGTISGTGVIQSHNDHVVTQNVKHGTTNISALTDYKAGWTWRVASNGTISGIGKVESGDMVMCISDYKSAYSASDWSAIQRNIDLATSNSAGLMSAQDKANLDGALTHLDGIDTKINSIEGDITNINKDLTTNYATKTEMGTVEDKADAAKSTANEAKGIANSLVNGTTKAKKAETADSATKATQDGNGKVINETYALRGEAVATQDLGKYVPVNKHTGGTLAFPLATQSAGGAMSSDDKKKLDDAEGTYYSSFNVTGTGWYRLVNVPQTNMINKYLLVEVNRALGSSAHNSFKIYYNSPNGWGDKFSNSFICEPLTRTNTQCVDKARLVFKGGASAQYIDAYIILPKDVTNLKVTIQSNINSQYLAKNPVGADGKEGVAEAVLIALPEGYSSIERNAYVGTTTTSRVVGGLISERAFQDINGARIDAQYATKTEMNSYLPETLKQGGYLDITREGHGNVIPYIQNDIAYFIERGGSLLCTVDGKELSLSDDVKKRVANGGGEYIDFSTSLIPSKTSILVMELSLPISFNYNVTIYTCSPGTCMAKDVKLEVYAPSLNEWKVVFDKKEQDNGFQYANTVVRFSPGGFDVKWNKIRFTYTNFNGSNPIFRLSEIGAFASSCDNVRAICLPRNGGEIYGGITPLNDNAYDLGASGKAWKNVFAKQLTSTAAEGTAPLVVSSKTMVANLNAQYARMLFSNSNAPVNAGNYYKPVYFSGGVPIACNVLDENKNFGGIPYVSLAGNFPIGKMLQFHMTSDEDTNKNANLRITARDANNADGEGLTIGGTTIASGKFAQYSGSVYAVATLSSYWVKLWSFSLKRTNSDRNITMYVTGRTANHKESSGIIKIMMRFSSKTVTNNGVTSVTMVPDISLRQVVGNIDISEFKLYYKVVSDDKGNISQGDFELWCNTEQMWGYRSAVILNSSAEGHVDNNAYKGTFFKNSFNTVQTPTLTDYVEMTNMEISQTAAKALAANNATNANFAEIVKSVAVPTTNNHILQYVSGQLALGDAAGNAKEGSNADHNLWSYPKEGTNASTTNANIQTLRLRWNSNFFHDLFMSPNGKYLWHRCVLNNTPSAWYKIVEATEYGKVIIEGTTQEDTLRIKNKDRSTGEIHIFNGEQGNAVIRHYEGSTPTDLKFNSTQVMHGSKILAYASDVTALQKEIANLKKTVQEQATLIEALQSALTWE